MRVDVSLIPKSVVKDGQRVRVNLRGSQSVSKLESLYGIEFYTNRTIQNRPFYGLKVLEKV